MHEESENLPKYFKSIKGLNPLTKPEEKELCERIANGDKHAIDKLVRHNLRIVVTIANRFIGQGLSIDDLIQEGNIGLFEAAAQWKVNGDARFINYAQIWVRKRINEAIAQKGRTVRRPHNKEYERYLDKKEGKEVANIRPVRLDDPITDDADKTIGDVILGADSAYEDSIEQDHMKSLVEKGLTALKDRDRKIVAAYFGIGRDSKQTSIAIAEELDMTNVRVCQIVNTSLTKMRTTLSLTP